MKILIIEDTKTTCDFISSVIHNHYSDIECDCALSFDNALTKIQSDTYDMLIIDYELDKDNPEKNGIELGKHLSKIKKYKNTPIVFETSFPEYVFQAVNSLNCVYYLLKPFKEIDIQKMLKKVFSKLTPELKLEFHNSNGIQTIIKISDIVYITSTHRKIQVMTSNTSYMFSRYTLSQIEKKSKNLLVRCHKSYIINPDYVKYADKLNNYVTLEWSSNTATIPIGRKYDKKLQ